MTRPGPKPVNAKRLEQEATQWACFFYTLRDGQPGYMQPTEFSPEHTVGTLITKGLLRGNASKETRKSRARVGKPLGPPILIPVSRAAAQLPETMQGLPVVKGAAIRGKKRQTVRIWSVMPPVVPKPHVWEQLKNAHTAPDIKKAARGIGNPSEEFSKDLRNAFSSTLEKWAQHPDKAISYYAEEIREAKKLPHYPKTTRKRSDDKRVVFLSKVMAGLTLGLAPISAVKRLSHWTWPSDWAEKPLREFEQRQKQVFSANRENP